MKKVLNLISTVLFCLLLCVGITACGVVQNFNLSFMVDGEVYHTIETTGAETIVIPDDPEKAGYEFDGWFWDNDVWEKPFTANSLLDAPISGDMKVYAKFKAAHEHAFTDYVSDGNATYDADGTKTAKCDVEGCNETNTVTDEGSKLKSRITFKTLTLEGNTAYGKVANGTTSFNMQNEIEVHGTVPYQVYTQGQVMIPTKICDVIEGNNTFYVLANIDGNEVTYTVTVRVRPLYTVNFNYESAILDTQEVEEDGFATMPEVGTVNIAYTIAPDYDLTQPITEDTDITIEKQVKDEMKPFKFSENGLTACSIHGVQEAYLSATELVVPSYVTLIQGGSFGLTQSLERITLPFVGEQVRTSSDAYQYPFGYIFGTTNRTGSVAVSQEFYNASSSSLTTITYYIPSTLKSVTVTGGNILRGAFYNCSNLTSVTLGDDVQSVGAYSFYQCSGLTGIALPEKVASVGAYAFYNCSNLSDVTLGHGVESIGDYAFSQCAKLPSFVVPDSVENIYGSAFRGCTRLSSITIGSSVTSIGDYAFTGCEKLIEVYNRSALSIVAGATNYGRVSASAFNVYTPTSGSRKMSLQGEYLCYADDVASEYYLVDYVGTGREIALPNQISGNDYIVLPYAFYMRSELTGVTFGNGVTALGREAFYLCYGLTSITIPSGVESIGYNAFYGCSSLMEVYNLSSLTIAEGSTDNGRVGYYAQNVYTDTDGGSSKLFTTQDGFICYADEEAGVYYLAKYVGTATAVTLPNQINGHDYEILARAFRGRSDLTSVTLGSGVTKIGVAAFENCSGLTSIVVSNSVTQFDVGVLRYCSNLTSITYQGTAAQWNALTKSSEWNKGTGEYTVYCTDGTIAKS